MWPTDMPRINIFYDDSGDMSFVIIRVAVGRAKKIEIYINTYAQKT